MMIIFIELKVFKVTLIGDVITFDIGLIKSILKDLNLLIKK